MSTDGFYFHIKQWLGDDAVLLMDWDVRAMHLHLMCIAWQKDPPGILPDDDALLRKWLSNPELESWTHRIKPQLIQGWRIANGKWHQDGLIREWDKQASNSQKRRAAANARWRKEPVTVIAQAETEALNDEANEMLLTIDGEPLIEADAGFSLTSLLKDNASFRQPASTEERGNIWSMGVNLLKHEGFSEDKVRSYLGKLIQEHGEKVVAEAVAALSLKAISPADAKSYIAGILRSETTKRRGRGRVAL